MQLSLYFQLLTLFLFYLRPLKVGRGKTVQVTLLRTQLMSSAEYSSKHLKLVKLNKV